MFLLLTIAAVAPFASCGQFFGAASSSPSANLVVIMGPGDPVQIIVKNILLNIREKTPSSGVLNSVYT